MTSIIYCLEFRKPHNVRVIPDAGDVEIVGADTMAKLSAETSRDRSFAAWDQRIVIPRVLILQFLNQMTKFRLQGKISQQSTNDHNPIDQIGSL